MTTKGTHEIPKIRMTHQKPLLTNRNQRPSKIRRRNPYRFLTSCGGRRLIRQSAPGWSPGSVNNE